MNALTLLTNDHKRVDRLFAEHKQVQGNPRRQKAIFDRVHRELDIHAQIEEQIFYPEVKERAQTKKLEELVTESYEEHHFVDTIKAEIEGTPFEAEEWAAKFKVMKENIEHHADEEEEGKMFPKVRQVFNKEELEDMGTRMQELKEKLMSGAPIEERTRS